MTRHVDRCPHRRPIPRSSHSSTEAECQLLREISGVAEPALIVVDRDACASCLDEIPADHSGLNPTLASLLYGLARSVARTGGVPGCSTKQAEELARRAEFDLAYQSVGRPNLTDGEIISVNRGRISSRPNARLGLIGWNTRTGLGRLNRDLARHLPIDRWLIPTHPHFQEVSERPGCPVDRYNGPESLRVFLEKIDILLFCENLPIPDVVPMVRRSGTRVACVAMWEYLDESAPWLSLVDLMICPTRICLDVARRLRERLGLGYELALFPWPIDLDQFPFRPRTLCERFLFINGNGGARERNSGRPGWDGRKGVGLIAESARLSPNIPIIVRSQTGRLPPFPANVEVRISDVDDPADLYLDGDVCIQPSRWEGLGLPMLECQASGLPLITTDAPPMNEHHPFRAVGGTASVVSLVGCRPIRSVEVEPAALARVLVDVHGSDITEASIEARQFIEESHSWKSRATPLLQILRDHANMSPR